MNQFRVFLFCILALTTVAFSGNVNAKTISFTEDKFEDIIQGMSRITESDEFKEFKDYAGSSFNVDFKIENGMDILTLSARSSCASVSLVTETSYKIVETRFPFKRKVLQALDQIEFVKEKAPCRAR